MEGCSPFGSEDTATTYAIVTGILGMVAGAVNFAHERRKPRELPWWSLLFLAGMTALGLVFSRWAIVDPEIYCGAGYRRGGLIFAPFCTGLLLVGLVGFTALRLSDRRFKPRE